MMNRKQSWIESEEDMYVLECQDISVASVAINEQSPTLYPQLPRSFPYVSLRSIENCLVQTLIRAVHLADASSLYLVPAGLFDRVTLYLEL